MPGRTGRGCPSIAAHQQPSDRREVPMIRSRTVHTIRELSSQGHSIHSIAREVGLSRNTVRKYLRGTPLAAARLPKGSKLDPYKGQIRRWVKEDRLLNCV